MNGMDRTTGHAIAGADHLGQSLGDLLTTPIGTRVMRRDYGSALPDLVDRPVNRSTMLLLYAATALAIARFEPRLKLARVAMARDDDGALVATLEGRRTDLPAANSLATLTIPLGLRAAA
jgi:uncharacterized protein